MSREIGSTNTASAEGASVEPVALLKLDLDDPVYAHSGVGVIEYDGNDYIGVGLLGSVTAPSETDELGPQPVTFGMSQIDANLMQYAMSAANYGDEATLYRGYRQDDGTLVSDPYIVWAGTVESTGAKVGPGGQIGITCNHDLAALDQINGGRYTDEDQQDKYSGDKFFSHIADIPTLKLLWGGGPTRTGSAPGLGPPERPPRGHIR